MRLLSSIEFVLLAQVGMTNDLTKRKENLCRWEFYIADGEIEIGGKVGSWLNLKMGSNIFSIFHNFLLYAIIAVILKFYVHALFSYMILEKLFWFQMQSIKSQQEVKVETERWNGGESLPLWPRKNSIRMVFLY